MRKATPTLKYCRGEPFKEEHWSALLQVHSTRTLSDLHRLLLRDMLPLCQSRKPLLGRELDTQRSVPL